MKDLFIGLFYLKEIESAPKGLTTDELHSRLGNAGFEVPVKRTVQRDLEDFRDRGIRFGHKNKRYSLTFEGENLRVFLEFLRELLLDKRYKSIFYGDLNVRRGTEYFSGRQGIASLFYDLIHSIIFRRMAIFDYAPQTDLTLFRMKIRQKFKPTDSAKIPVRMLPRYLVISGESFLVLGEFYEKESFYKNHFGKPKQRQYELRGISSLRLVETSKPVLDINPYELYQNSVQVWVGGKIHDLVVEEVFLPSKVTEKKIRKVNGEDEILSLVAASLGRLRIINPPRELIRRAEVIGLPQELVFRFE